MGSQRDESVWMEKKRATTWRPHCVPLSWSSLWTLTQCKFAQSEFPSGNHENDFQIYDSLPSAQCVMIHDMIYIYITHFYIPKSCKIFFRKIVFHVQIRFAFSTGKYIPFKRGSVTSLVCCTTKSSHIVHIASIQLLYYFFFIFSGYFFLYSVVHVWKPIKIVAECVPLRKEKTQKKREELYLWWKGTFLWQFRLCNAQYRKIFL